VAGGILMHPVVCLQLFNACYQPEEYVNNLRADLQGMSDKRSKTFGKM